MLLFLCPRVGRIPTRMIKKKSSFLLFDWTAVNNCVGLPARERCLIPTERFLRFGRDALAMAEAKAFIPTSPILLLRKSRTVKFGSLATAEAKACIPTSPIWLYWSRNSRSCGSDPLACLLFHTVEIIAEYHDHHQSSQTHHRDTQP